ncbi:MAG: hypothetical protein WHT06_15850 [Desulfobacterales bacterium]
MPSIIYNNFREDIGKGTIKLDSDTFKVMLLANTYTPNAEHTTPSQVNTHELANGNGYVTGGVTLQSVVWSRSGSTVKFDANDAEWSEATFTARYGVIYSATANRLVACIDFGSDKSCSNQSFFIRWHDDGIITLT